MITGMRPGAVVDLEVRNPEFDFMWKYIKAREGKAGWKARIAEILANFDPARFQPLHYCCPHKRFEDGTHRLHIAEIRGDRTIKIRGYGYCYPSRQAMLKKLLLLTAEHPGAKAKDPAWLAACHEKKWRHLYRTVDYKGRTVLDIGSQSGYICMATVKAGAVSALGIEIRPEMVNLAQKAARLFNYERKATFRIADWLAVMPIKERYDIVHALGVAHYFPAARYWTAISAMAVAARERLILELRLSTNPGDGIETAGTQTLPTHGALRAILDVAGFTVEQTFPVVGQKRQLWIARRTG